MAFSLTRTTTHGIFIGVDIGHPLTGGNERPMRPSKVSEDEQKSRRKNSRGRKKRRPFCFCSSHDEFARVNSNLCMALTEKVAAANKINDLMKTVLTHSGLRLKYRIAVNPAATQ